MKFLTAAGIVAFGTRGISAADAITNTTSTFEIKEKDPDIISNAALGSCPQCEISNFIGTSYSFRQRLGRQYLWTINNLGQSGSQFNQKETSGRQFIYFIGSYSSRNGQVVSYTNGSDFGGCPRNRRGTFEIVLTSDPGQNGILTASEPQICVYKVERKCYCPEPTDQPISLPSDIPSDQPSSMPSDIPSDIPSDQPSSVPSSMPSDIPSDIPSDQPSSVPSSMPSDILSDVPSDSLSSMPSDSPSDQPSSEPSWVDEEQCKKRDPEDDICAALDGRCKLDCKDDEDFVCVPGLCSYDRYWDRPTKSPKMHALMEEDAEVVDMEITADGNIERKLKATKALSEKEKSKKASNALSEKEKSKKASKAPKTTKAPKSSCACRVPRKHGCKN